jgi:hypothetical protein
MHPTNQGVARLQIRLLAEPELRSSELGWSSSLGFVEAQRA